METLKKIGEKLKNTRKLKNLTQSDVANELGVQREQISYIETGAREIPLAFLTKMASVYGKNVSYFLEGIEEPELKVAYRAENLTRDDKDKIEWAKRFVTNLYELEKTNKR